MPELLMPFNKEKFRPITNGFDEDDFEKDEAKKVQDHFVIFHAGLLNDLRDPESLWRACAELCQENKAFAEKLRIHLVGMIDAGIQKRLTENNLLKNSVILEGYKSHDEVLAYYKNASLLLKPF